MKISQEEKDHLYELEVSLWKPETRFDIEYMNKVMTDDFFEFGRSGKIYTKAESISAPMQEINAIFPLKDFAVHEINDDVVLVTYISEVQYEQIEIGNRSSIWVKRDGEWRLRFHQGTPVHN